MCNSQQSKVYTVYTGIESPAPNVNSTATASTPNLRSRHSSSGAMGLEFSVGGTVCTGIESSAPNMNSTTTGVTHNSRSLLSQRVDMDLELSVTGMAAPAKKEQNDVGLELSVSGMELFSKETELNLKTEELELTRLQKNLLELKYDLLKKEFSALEGNTLLMRAKLEAYTCSICLTNLKDCILEPCGHFVGCMRCINLLPDSKCPICRMDCNYYIRVFNS